MSMMNINPLSATDFYKTGHRAQYPDGTTLVYSNGTCRSDKHFKGLPDFDHKVVNFGLQGICQWLLIDFWNDSFFNQPKRKAVRRHKRTLEKALNVKDFDAKHLEDLYDLGYLPISIKALPEGARINMKVPTYTIVNTHDDFSWLTNYLETQIQSESWKCKVAATTAYEFRRLFDRYAEETGIDKSFVDFQGHDFSMRGMSGIQDATQCGGGHLLSFKGTDTVSAIEYLENYYQGAGGYILEDKDSPSLEDFDDKLDRLYASGVRVVIDLDTDEPKYYKIIKEDGLNFKYSLEAIDDPKTFIGGSVPATEHAVSSMNGVEGELTFFRRLITETYPNGIVSLVSDTYDFWRAVTEHMVTLKDEIMARDGKVLLRPDSGDPVDIICGTASDYSKEPELKYAISKACDHNYEVDGTGEGDFIEVVSYKGKYYVDESDVEYKNLIKPNPLVDPLNEEDYSEEDAALEEYGWVEINPTPEMKGAVECLWEIFGGTETVVEKTDGESIEQNTYKTLDSHIGLIYGDSINLDRAQRILAGLKSKGFSSANIVFGIGSFTYQFVTRDTLGEAVKATFGIVNGEEREIFKDPKTGDGVKKSAKGLLRVEQENSNYVLYDQQTWEQEAQGELNELFRDSVMMRIDSLDNIRNRLHTVAV